MEEKDKIALAQDWVRKLANGINPLNGNAVKEEDVVNNVHISRCLFYVADLLGKYSEKRTKTNSSRTIPFSAFARELKNLIPENMQSVSYKSMTTWLIQEGMLSETISDNGHTYKIATEKGEENGIYTEERERENGGHFLLTLYNREAQRLLLEHLEEISHIH